MIVFFIVLVTFYSGGGGGGGGDQRKKKHQNRPSASLIAPILIYANRWIELQNRIMAPRNVQSWVLYYDMLAIGRTFYRFFFFYWRNTVNTRI